ncbi:MAG: hypothetical protein PHY18_01870 [Dehalococcoidales bacterium]|nr:hypothetical protein [Dehalococcoidales bacterium]
MSSVESDEKTPAFVLSAEVLDILLGSDNYGNTPESLAYYTMAGNAKSIDYAGRYICPGRTAWSSELNSCYDFFYNYPWSE